MICRSCAEAADAGTDGSLGHPAEVCDDRDRAGCPCQHRRAPHLADAQAEDTPAGTDRAARAAQQAGRDEP